MAWWWNVGKRKQKWNQRVNIRLGREDDRRQHKWHTRPDFRWIAQSYSTALPIPTPTPLRHYVPVDWHCVARIAYTHTQFNENFVSIFSLCFPFSHFDKMESFVAARWMVCVYGPRRMKTKRKRKQEMHEMYVSTCLHSFHLCGAIY